MATSGTRSWTMTVDDILREAAERLGGEQILGNELPSARRSLNIVITDLLNENVALHQLTEASVTCSTSLGVYQLPTSIVDVMDMALRRSGIDIRMDRIGFSDYLQIPNKAMTGRPIQYFVDRQYDRATVRIWPLPVSLSTMDVMVMWQSRRIQDITQLNQDVAMPFRFMPVLAAGVAYQWSMKRPGITPDRIMMLKAQYDEAKALATQEDRDRVTLRIQPYVAWY